MVQNLLQVILVNAPQYYKKLEVLKCIAFFKISLHTQICDKMLSSLDNFILYFRTSPLCNVLSCSHALIRPRLEVRSCTKILRRVRNDWKQAC